MTIFQILKRIFSGTAHIHRNHFYPGKLWIIITIFRGHQNHFKTLFGIIPNHIPPKIQKFTQAIITEKRILVPIYSLLTNIKNGKLSGDNDLG